MQRAPWDCSALPSLADREAPAIPSGRKLPFLASERTASERFCDYCLETGVHAVCKILLREAETIRGRICVSIMKKCFLFAFYFSCGMFVFKIDEFYSRAQIKLSKRNLIPGVVQQHHQVFAVVFSSQMKMLDQKWPRLGVWGGAGCPFKSERNVGSASKEG